jgi:peptide deformylase
MNYKQKKQYIQFNVIAFLSLCDSIFNMKIIKDSNPIMRKKSVEVPLPLSEEDRNTLNMMSEYLKNSQDDEWAEKHNVRPGIGLAAIQIGLLKRMFVIYLPYGDRLIEYQLVNPKIIETSVKRAALENGEGCLSVDKNHHGLVHRYYKIKIKAFNALTNKEEIIVESGYPAIALQHEYDHLEGMFFYDRINKFNPNEPYPNEEII